MTLHFTKKLTLLFISLILLIGFAFVGLYYLKIKPVQQDIEQATKRLENEQRLLSTYENKASQTQREVRRDTTDLQRKVPVKPILEQFLLDLEKAEVVSGSLISSMSFGHQDVNLTAEDAATLESQIENAGQLAEAEQIQNGEQEADPTAEAPALPPPSELPPGMKRLTIQLSVQSPDYYAMETFLKAIEDLERITKIDNLSFTGKRERTSLNEDEDPSLSYNLTISTFYHPGLEQLQNELPPFETPEPGNKLNPLAQATKPATKESEPTDKQDIMPVEEQVMSIERSTVLEKNDGQAKDTSMDGKATKIITHQVQPGESLYSISVKYYDTFKKEDFLQQWNKLDTNIIYVDQVIEIPLEY